MNGKESVSGIVIKWCEKREVLMLLTKQASRVLLVTSRNVCNCEKIIWDHGRLQSKVSLTLNNSVRLHCKMVQENDNWTPCWFGNGKCIYSTRSVIEVRENIANVLLHIGPHERPLSGEKHVLQAVKTSNRRRCVLCYKNLSEEHNRKYAASKATQTRWKCVQCAKFYCVTCFTTAHTSTL